MSGDDGGVGLKPLKQVPHRGSDICELRQMCAGGSIVLPHVRQGVNQAFRQSRSIIGRMLIDCCNRLGQARDERVARLALQVLAWVLIECLKAA
jgi:hypothetical protein